MNESLQRVMAMQQQANQRRLEPQQTGLSWLNIHPAISPLSNMKMDRRDFAGFGRFLRQPQWGQIDRVNFHPFGMLGKPWPFPPVQHQNTTRGLLD